MKKTVVFVRARGCPPIPPPPVPHFKSAGICIQPAPLILRPIEMVAQSDWIWIKIAIFGVCHRCIHWISPCKIAGCRLSFDIWHWITLVTHIHWHFFYIHAAYQKDNRIARKQQVLLLTSMHFGWTQDGESNMSPCNIILNDQDNR